MKYILILISLFIITSCGSAVSKDGIRKSENYYKVRSATGWSGEIAFQSAVDSGVIPNQAVALTSSDQDEIMVYFDRYGKLLRVSVFNSKPHAKKLYAVKSKAGNISGKSIRLEPIN